MTSFASTLSHPDWKIWVLATPTNSGPNLINFDEVIKEEPAATNPNITPDLSIEYKPTDLYLFVIAIQSIVTPHHHLSIVDMSIPSTDHSLFYSHTL
ncbi:unnamed protein product [Absidia cylindrospora]